MQLSLLSAAGRRTWLVGVASLVVGSVTAGTSSDAVRGYNGSGAPRGYNGSGAPRGYNGSGAPRGYNGSGAPRGYNGSGAPRGYNGSGAPRGYNGSGAPRSSEAQVLSSCAAFGDGFDVAAMGAVESVSQAGEMVTLVILGQTFDIPAAAADEFDIGDFAIAATSATSGTVAYHAGEPYVAGISAVSLKAPVSTVDAHIGRASVGAAVVDYTALLSASEAEVPRLGESFVAVGTQPVLGGVILAGPSTGSAVGCSALDGRM
jgi:hypothetical protein